MSPKTYRVAHYGTGDTGAQALREVIARSDLELVAHLVHTPEKAGRDSGELVGVNPVGLSATTDFDEFLACDADCVAYFATDFGREESQVIDEMAAILASGKNIVTSTMPALSYPPQMPREITDRLEDGCKAGNSSFFCSGIAPGYTTDAFIIACGSVSHAIKSITLSERVFMATYQDPMVFNYLGFGRPPDEPAMVESVGTGGFLGPLLAVAKTLGTTFDNVRTRREVAVADADYKCPAGAIPEGTVATVRFVHEALVGGQPRVTMSIVYSMIDKVVDEWAPVIVGTPDINVRTSQVVIDGTPKVDVVLSLSGGDQPGVDATAGRVVNAIPTVCDAAPGLYSSLDMPVWGRADFGN
jgi:2,4-diaminopentanoate dehydrogenase